MLCSRFARRALAVSVLALAWTPNAFADGLLVPVTGVTGEVGVAEIGLPVEAPSVPAPVVSVPALPAASVPPTVAEVAAPIEDALPAAPRPAGAVSTVSATIAGATRAATATVSPTTARSGVAGSGPVPGHATVAKSPRAATESAVVPTMTRSIRRIAPRTDPQHWPAPTWTRESSTGIPAVRVLSLASDPTLAVVPRSSAPERTETSIRGTTAERSTQPPLPRAPHRSSTTTFSPGGVSGGFVTVCAALLSLVLVARGAGRRMVQLVAEPHPHSFLLRLERPG